MKKMYRTSIISAFLLGVILPAVQAEEELTFKIRGFAESEWQQEKTLSEENSQVIISFSRHTFETLSNVWVEGEQYPSFDFIKLCDSSNESNSNVENNLNYSSYILIEIPEGKDPVARVEVIGYAHGAAHEYDFAYLTEAYSTTSSVASDFALSSPSDPYTPWGGTLYIMGAPGDIASNGWSAVYTNTRLDMFTGMPEAIPFTTEEDLKSIRFIRLNWSGAQFANLNPPERGRPVALFGLNIYTIKTDLPTTMEHPQGEDELAATQQKDKITFNREVEVQLFSLNGSMLKQETNTCQFSTTGIEKGIYILKATDKNQHSITTKIVCK